MIMIKDLKRILRPIRNKIFLLFARGILKSIKDTEGTQKMQITCLANEVIDEIEKFQDYGFESKGLAGAEVATIFLDGNRDHGLVICVHDRRYRPKDLSAGDVRVYDYRGNKITCQSTGIKMECINGNTIEMVAGEVKINGENLEILI